MMERKIRRGEIYIADLDPVVGSEQGGERPVLVIQNNVGNTHSPTVIVLAITGRCQKKKYMPTHIPIESSDLSMSSIALAEQVRTVDKTRLTRYVGRASKESMDAVDQALKVSMGVSHHGITDEKLKAIENWRNKGNKFGIVSGRGKTFRSELLQEHPNLRIDFFAACNGAYITDADGNVIFEKRCSDVSLPKFADDLFEWGCKCVHVNAERYVCIVQKAEHRPAWVSERVTCLPEDVPSFDYFNQVSVQLPSVEDSTIVVEKIRNKYSKWLNPLQNSVCIDIVPAGINKAEGLYRVMEYYGGEYKDMITVGDNINDIDMIREFRSYAMKNGVEAVKNLASGIVSDVIEILEKEL